MAAITKRRIFGVLATAQCDDGFFFDDQFFGGEGGILVGAIAEGLFSGFPAGAPHIRPRFQRQDIGTFLGDDGAGHEHLQ